MAWMHIFVAPIPISMDRGSTLDPGISRSAVQCLVEQSAIRVHGSATYSKAAKNDTLLVVRNGMFKEFHMGMGQYL